MFKFCMKLTGRFSSFVIMSISKFNNFALQAFQFCFEMRSGREVA